MEIESDDYVKPPPYLERKYHSTDTKSDDSDSLITKLKLKIYQDIYQINGVYDIQIAEHQSIKNIKVCKLEEEYKIIVDSINKQRKKDIDIYRNKAERCVDNFIIAPEIESHQPSICNKNKYSWLQWLGIIK